MSKHLYCLTAKATVDAEATVFKVSGSYDSPTMDLFFGKLRLSSKTDLNMLSVGGVISTGVSLTKKAWRLHVVAGMNALFGAREDLDVKFVPNQERLSSLVDSAMNFASTSMIMSNFHYHVLYPRSRK